MYVGLPLPAANGNGKTMMGRHGALGLPAKADPISRLVGMFPWLWCLLPSMVLVMMTLSTSWIPRFVATLIKLSRVN